MHLADLASYQAVHESAAELYRDQEEWSRRAILNIAASSKFSSDRTISEYAGQIWDIPPCPVEPHLDPRTTLEEAKSESARKG